MDVILSSLSLMTASLLALIIIMKAVIAEDEPCGCMLNGGQWSHGLIAFQIVRILKVQRSITRPTVHYGLSFIQMYKVHCWRCAFYIEGVLCSEVNYELHWEVASCVFIMRYPFSEVNYEV